MRAVRSPSGVVVAGEDVSLSLLFLLLLGAEIMSIMLGYHDEDIYLSVSFLPSRGCGFIYLLRSYMAGMVSAVDPIDQSITASQGVRKARVVEIQRQKETGKKRTPVYVCVNVLLRKLEALISYPYAVSILSPSSFLSLSPLGSPF